MAKPLNISVLNKRKNLDSVAYSQISYGGHMKNNVTANKPTTINGYKVNGNNVILTPTQMQSMTVNYEMMGNLQFDTIEAYICTLVSNVLKSHNVTITSYQVGNDKTGSNSELMNDFMSKISELEKEFVSQFKNEIFAIEGKHFWIDGKKKLREFSATFTARTPEGYSAKSYQEHLTKKANELGMSLDNETEDVVKEEEKEVNSEVINEI